MKLVGLMPVRNEAWILGLSARVALLWCDELVVYLHCCTDESQWIMREIYAESKGRVHFIHGFEPTWNEMPQRQAMLTVARERGATHLAIIDADEVLTGNLCALEPYPWRDGYHPFIGLDAGYQTIVQLPLYNLRGSLTRYHTSGVWGCNRFLSLTFADDPRLRWEGDRFHKREPQGATLNPYQPIKHGQGGVMHLWAVDEKRCHEKHRLYRLTERLRFPNKPASEIEALYDLWRCPEASAAMWPQQTDWQKPWTFADFPESWWSPYKDLIEKYYHPEIEPWQTAECERILAKYGREHFKGLSV